LTQLTTQETAYWTDDFKINQDDVEYLFNVLLEKEIPLSMEELALALVRYRVSSEQHGHFPSLIDEKEYRPDRHYDIGDRAVFQHDISNVGTVVAIRPGENPDYGEFSVLKVEFADESSSEYAADLALPHSLATIDAQVNPSDDETEQSPEEIFIDYGGEVVDALEKVLQEQSELVRIAGRWFPRSLLADVSTGELNLAEAVLDMNDGGPLSPQEILHQIDVLQGVNTHLAEFSLNYGMQNDDRFDEVGPAGQVQWFLHRLEPHEVVTPPKWLAYTPFPYNADAFNLELRDIELEIGDEHSHVPISRGPRPQSVTVLLTYPHLRAGTLPLSPQLRGLFPTAYESNRIRFTLVDTESGDEFPAWVVRPYGYVYGLAEWFGRHNLLVGSYLTIERTNQPGHVKIGYRHRKSRSEWIRTVAVDGTRLRIQNSKVTVGCDYDEQMVVVAERSEDIDKLWVNSSGDMAKLRTLLPDICRELAQLNPQRHIHARTIYSVVNLFVRCPPGPIFTALATIGSLEYVGGAYWRLMPSGEG
jgi:hypothetical protein